MNDEILPKISINKELIESIVLKDKESASYIQKNIIELGKTTGDFNGVTLPVYDRERIICDCFKYRSKIDNEMFNKALNAYVKDEKKNLINLSKYAKEMRVYVKMMDVMEVLLNG